MPSAKVIVIGLILVIVVSGITAYEFNEFTWNNSIKYYTKVSISPLTPSFITFGTSVYNVTFSPHFASPKFHYFTFQISINNSSQGFIAMQGSKCYFSGISIAVGNVKSNQLILYVIYNASPLLKPTISPSTTSSPTQ